MWGHVDVVVQGDQLAERKCRVDEKANPRGDIERKGRGTDALDVIDDGVTLAIHTPYRNGDTNQIRRVRGREQRCSSKQNAEEKPP